MLGQSALSQLLHHRGDRGRRHLQPLCEGRRADDAVAPALERIDGLGIILDRLRTTSGIATPPSDANQQPGREHHRHTGQQPATAVGCRTAPASSRSEGASCTITWTIAPAPKPNRNAGDARVERGRADPGAEHRRRAGDQAEQAAAAATAGRSARSARRSRAPRWCCGSRSRRPGTHRARAHRPRRRSRWRRPRRGCEGRSRPRRAAPALPAAARRPRPAASWRASRRRRVSSRYGERRPATRAPGRRTPANPRWRARGPRASRRSARNAEQPDGQRHQQRAASAAASAESRAARACRAPPESRRRRCPSSAIRPKKERSAARRLDRRPGCSWVIVAPVEVSNATS